MILRSLWAVLMVVVVFQAEAQTNTTSSGTWNDPSIWSAGVPTGTSTANVNNTVEINTNIAITSGTYNIFQSATDFPGGAAYTLSVGNGGTIDVQGGTTNFEGVIASVTSNGASIRVRSGATLILTGPTSFANGTTVLIDAGGTLIINGNFTNNIAGAGSFTVQGLVQINGNYSSNGNVDVLGSGDLVATGTITTTGGSGSVFGSPNDCTSGPCSGANLCLGGGTTNIISANQYICSGGSAASLTGDAISGVTGYQWQSSITSASTGFTNISGATSQNYNPGTPTQTTWYKRQASITGCTGTSAAIVIVIIPSASWSGTSSTDWNVGANWCSGVVPTSSTDVTIQPGVPNQPTISAATTALCRNLTIANGATLTINSTRQLNVSGNISVAGSLVNNGTIQFNGTSAQTISGSGFSAYENVIVNNSSGATPALTIPSTGLNVRTQLTLTAGKISLNSANLTIGTAVGSAGTLSYSSGWFYNGNLTRWIGPGALTLGNAPGHFPIGSSTDYRPAFFGSTSVTTGGTIRVNHTAISGPTNLSPTFSDGGTTVLLRSNSFWTIATGNSMPANTFDLRTEGTGFGTVGNVSHLRLIQLTAATGTAGTNAGSTTNPQVNRTGISTTNLNNNFYWGSTNSVLTPLPVTLIAFSGSQWNESIRLKWETASEKNFDYFLVEKSMDGKAFAPFGKVAGKGSSNAGANYLLDDEKPVIGNNYYRLRAVDLDGTSEIFDVILVDYSKQKNFDVYPNPVTKNSLTAKINFLDLSSCAIVIYDQMGKVVHSAPLTSIETEFTFSTELLNGVYFAKLISPDFTKTVRFLVLR